MPLEVNRSKTSSAKFLLDEIKDRICDCLEVKDWKGMSTWSRKWIEFDPKSGEGFKWLARASLQLKNANTTSWSYSRLLDFEPQNKEAIQYFKTFNQNKDDPSTASSKAKDIPVEPTLVLPKELRSKFALMELKIAKEYEKFKLYNQAYESYVKSFDWVKNEEATLGLCRMLIKLNRGLEALNFMKQRINSHPNWVEGRMQLGKILYSLGYKADAQREWQFILKQDPNNLTALKLLRSLL